MSLSAGSVIAPCVAGCPTAGGPRFDVECGAAGIGGIVVSADVGFPVWPPFHRSRRWTAPASRSLLRMERGHRHECQQHTKKRIAASNGLSLVLKSNRITLVLPDLKILSVWRFNVIRIVKGLVKVFGSSIVAS